MAKGIPSYRLHKPSQQAVVRIEGKDLYLGRYGTRDSRSKDARWIAEWQQTSSLGSTSFSRLRMERVTSRSIPKPE